MDLGASLCRCVDMGIMEVPVDVWLASIPDEKVAAANPIWATDRVGDYWPFATPSVVK